MKVLIIEDEKPATDRLIDLLGKIDPAIIITGTCQSVHESLKWFDSNPAPDLIFLDIHLTDGLSLKLFDKSNINTPIIFTTAYDEYILEAFNHTTIDYLLKPIKESRLRRAIQKYKTLGTHFTQNISRLVEHLQDSHNNFRTRFTVKSGLDFITINVDDIAYFFTEHKIVFLQTCGKEKYIIDKSLSELEKEVNSKRFFRINRKIIANISFITKFKSQTNGKLAVELKPNFKEPVIVSQEKAAEFRKWMEG